MTHVPARVVLLGPQRTDPDVGRVVADLGVGGAVVLITAGWQEWEEDDARLREPLGREAVNLSLYARSERVWREDHELALGHRELLRRVRALRRAYNVRLARAMDAWTDLLDTQGDAVVLEPEREAALDVVKALDVHHADRLMSLRGEFDARFDPLARPSVVREREQLRRVLASAEGVVIAGGHLPALLNRLRIFGVDELLGGKVVVASSAGAMSLAERVVLFHDRPPWGPGHAELGEVGLGVVPGVVALPDATARLRLDDPGRVGRMAQRFAPDMCVLLDPGARVEWDGRWHAHGALALTPDGEAGEWRPAA